MTDPRRGATSGPDLGAALADAFEAERRAVPTQDGAETEGDPDAPTRPEPPPSAPTVATGGTDLRAIRDELAAQREMLTSIENRLDSPDVLLVEDPVVGVLAQRLRGAEEELRRLAEAANGVHGLLTGISEAVDALRRSGRAHGGES